MKKRSRPSWSGTAWVPTLILPYNNYTIVLCRTQDVVKGVSLPSLDLHELQSTGFASLIRRTQACV